MKKFIITFLISFAIFFLLETLVEFLLSYYYGIDLHNLNLGWLGTIGIIIILGFKYHIVCCLIPLIWSAYKCKHNNNCKHEHCKK